MCMFSNSYGIWDHIVTYKRYEIYNFIFRIEFDCFKTRNNFIFNIITSY